MSFLFTSMDLGSLSNSS